MSGRYHQRSAGAIAGAVCKALSSLQPTRDAQPGLVGGQDFVFQRTAFEKHTFATHRRNGLYMIVVIDAQFATILFQPVGIEVLDHRKGAVWVVLELIQVSFVKSALFVQGVVKLISRDAGVASCIEVGHKTVYEVKEVVFMRIVVRAVQPVDLITPHPIVLYQQGIVADTSRLQVLIRIEGMEIGFQVCRQRAA